MTYLLPIPLATPWLLTAIVLYVLAAFLGVVVYAPTMQEQRRQLGAAGTDSVDFKAVSRRGTWLGLLVSLDVVAIVFLMVVRPALWGQPRPGHPTERRCRDSTVRRQSAEARRRGS